MWWYISTIYMGYCHVKRYCNLFADSERMRRISVKLPPTPKHGVGLFTRLVKDSEPVWMGTPSIYWAFPLVEVYLCPSKSAKS